MKKILSVLLSLLMIASCMTCLLTCPAGTAMAVKPSVNFRGENLLADYTAANFKNVDGNAASTPTDTNLDLGDGNIPAISLGGTIWQAYCFEVDLEAGKSYELAMGIKSNYSLSLIRIYKASDYVEKSKVSASGRYIANQSFSANVVNGATLPSNEVAPNAHNFSITETDKYVVLFAFDGTVDNANGAYNCGWVYNLGLWETSIEIKAVVEGNGAACAEAVESGVKFTATPYQESSFLGWYDGETLVSNELVYTYTYTEVASRTFTAKFTDVNLLADYTATNWYWKDGTSKSMDISDSVFGGKCIGFHDPRYQALYTTVSLAANTTYNFSAYMFGHTDMEVYRVLKAEYLDIAKTPGEAYSTSDYIVNARKDMKINSTTPAAEYAFKFKTQEAGDYVLVLKFGGREEAAGGGWYTYISDCSLVAEPKNVNVEANVEGNGAVKITKSNVGTTTTYTLTATAYLDSEFLGWYDGESLISTDKVYTFAVTDDTTYTAKFTDVNLAAKANFAGKWQKASYSWVTIGDSDDSCNGGSAVAFTNTVQYQAAYLPLTLKPNAKYGISLNYKVTGVKKQEISVIGPDLSIDPKNDSGGMRNGGTPLLILFDSSDEVAELPQFKNYSGYFKTPNSDEETVTCYLYLKHDRELDATRNAVISDLSIVEYEEAETLTIDMKSCASIDPLDFEMDSIHVGKECKFKVVDNMDTEAVVTVNGTVLTPVDGVYTFTSEKNNTISVRFAGDENLNDWDKDYKGNDLSAYNKDLYLTPVWEGNTVYQETALFVTGKEEVKLLYPVDKVVSLRSYDLKINYVEGVDYAVTADGNIRILPNSRIPVYEGGLTTDVEPVYKFPLKDNENVWLKAIGDVTYTRYAISVTYEHSKTHTGGYTPKAPQSQTNALAGTIAKLEAGETVNIVIFGDSISCGWSSSGLNNKEVYDKDGNVTSAILNVAPYAPTWAEMVIAELREKYPNAIINVKNLSLGGMDSGWGANNIATRLGYWKDENDNQVVPDLMLTGFGVNDAAGNVSVADFKARMQKIVTNARNASGNANMEVLMYSGMLPNQLTDSWDAETKMIPYENAMKEIAAADSKVGVAAVTSVFTEIIKSKNPEDYLNTNWNHGNDFTARIYATTILAAFEEPEVNFVLGDVTGDGEVKMGDYAKILAHVKGTSLLTTPEQLLAADVTGDGQIKMGDYAKVLAHVKGTSLLF